MNSDVHNRVVKYATEAIVKPVLKSGGKYTDVMVVMESVMVSVVRVVRRLAGEELISNEAVVNALTKAVLRRLEEQ